LISKDRQFLFVHIPKTAGSSLKEAMGGGWSNHKDIARYRKELGEELFAQYFKFTVVRNPWDRMVSDYRYQTRVGGHRTGKMHVFDERGRRRNFAEWVDAVFADPGAYPPKEWGGEVSAGIHRWSPQADWVAPGGELAVDLVIRFEEFSESIGALGTRLGISIPKPEQKKRMLRRPYPEYYSAGLRDRVAEYYADDLRLFGYTFDESASRTGSWIERLLVKLGRV
jgi:hypothetical protein